MPIHSGKVYLLLGTHKGAFMFEADPGRKQWNMKWIFHDGVDVNHFVIDTRNGQTMYACTNSPWFGPAFQYSKDFGATWNQSETPIRFKEGSEQKINRIWHVAIPPNSQPDLLYAGADPGALFRSTDGGKNWMEIEALTNHPTRNQWMPGAGGMMVHSFCFDPADAQRMYVGISAAGTFFTEDGGKSWEPRNKGVLAEFLPNKYPEVGQCVHHMESHAEKPNVLYQQNHCGVYRTDDGGLNWVDIGQGLPAQFGFPLKIHPKDPDTIYVIPEVDADFRCPPEGKLAVYRSRNRGETWEKLNRGLPDNAFLNINRQAMAADNCDSTGLYFGTSTGQVFYSLDNGDSWQLLADFLPPIFSVECIQL